MKIKTVGSVCSGIEAASVAWKPLGLEFEWFSEIASFPSQVLKVRYPNIPNLGDMNDIPDKLNNNLIDTPDLICAGTPCQAFSLAGWKNGLNDDRGNLTIKFVDIVESNDEQRLKKGLKQSIVFWENVEGVLKDKTNAFGCMISSLAGLSEILKVKKWPNAGVLYGPKRNIAWRVIDAKYFGVPQQRRRLYLLAGGNDFYPENILFEDNPKKLEEFSKYPLTFKKDNHTFEVFREYTDCLYSAYGTKWNGNAAAYNGSLFIVQNGNIRRLSPLECERLMGFPDNYTNIEGAKKTNRYQGLGNSWVVPVVRWIGQRILNYSGDSYNLKQTISKSSTNVTIQEINDEGLFIDLGKNTVKINDSLTLNCTAIPNTTIHSNLKDIVSADSPKDIYISPVGCYGIIRRKIERNVKINPRLEEVLLDISSKMTPEEIEKRSRVQKRGRFSNESTNDTTIR